METGTGTWVAIATAIGIVIGAIGTVIVKVYDSKGKLKEQEAKLKAEEQVRVDKAKQESEERERNTRNETIQQSLTFNSQLMNHQTNLRNELLQVYSRLNETLAKLTVSEENRNLLWMHIERVEEKYAIPSNERMQRPSAVVIPVPVIVPAVTAAQPDISVDPGYPRRANEQETQIILKQVEKLHEKSNDSG